MNDVGYPTIFSASETTLVQFEGEGLEKILKLRSPRLVEPRKASLEHTVILKKKQITSILVPIS